MQAQPSVTTIADFYRQAFGVALANLIEIRSADNTMDRMARDDAARLSMLRDLSAARAAHLRATTAATIAGGQGATSEPLELMYLTAAEVAGVQTILNWHGIEGDRLTAVGATILSRV